MTDKGYQSKEKVYIELHSFYSFPGNAYNIVAENISSPQYPSYHVSQFRHETHGLSNFY